MRLAKLSRAAGKNNGWKIYESVRIPDPDGGRREIDMVINWWQLNFGCRTKALGWIISHQQRTSFHPKKKEWFGT